MASFIALLLIIISLVIGIPVAFAFLIAATYVIVASGYQYTLLVPFGYSKMDTIVILAIPLFIVAGGLITRAKVGEKLVALVELFVGRIKGGMGAVAIVSCAVFGSITGSAMATLSAIGSIMFPKLKELGYPDGHSSAIMANASVLGMLIPPSSIMILYAWVGQTSVLACFLATFIPGIILTILLSIVNMFLLRNNKNMVIQPKLPPKVFTTKLVKLTSIGLPALFMPVLILGGIYGGVVTPTEAAALSIVYTLPVGFFIYKGLTWKNVGNVLEESAVTTGAIMIMMFSIMILGRLFIMEDLPNLMLNVLKMVTENKLIILFMINIFMVIIGMLMDDISAVLLVTPIFLPIVKELGISPIHFAAIVAVNLGFGNVTPPTAPLLYLSNSLNGARLKESMMPTIYLLFFAWVPVLTITTFFPGLSLWLPQLLMGTVF
jgi:tripartite ATP-independent transporter DctM subunit